MPALDRSTFGCFRVIGIARATRLFSRLLMAACAVAVVGLFLPWTQNIRARGTVTSLSPDQRPQTRRRGKQRAIPTRIARKEEGKVVPSFRQGGFCRHGFAGKARIGRL
ncbi:MAG: hypothetical protein ACK4L7_07575, partial [Flavobacteriales bacterium]